MIKLENIKKLFNKNQNKGLVVLSLFDGISCGQVALERAGIKVQKYYASEIDKNAIQITQKNFPNTIQLGDVRSVDTNNLPEIDLLIGGSPCQDLSCCGKREGLNGKKSSLFFEYLRILKEIKPKYFLLENNASMASEIKEFISSQLECSYIEINSNLLSAQNRRRLYWTNIPNVQLPDDKKIFLKDILQPIEDKKEFDCTQRLWAKKKGTMAYTKAWGHICNLNQKSRCLTTGNTLSCSGSTIVKYSDSMFFLLSPIERERLQTLPDDYTAGVSNTQRYKQTGNGWTVDVIAHIFKGLKNDSN